MADQKVSSLVLKAALDLQGFFQERRWRFCFIGGLAYQPWGEARSTLDVDVTLMTGLADREEVFIDEMLRHYEARSPNAREFALINRVLLLKSGEGIQLDIALGALDFEERVVQRSVTRLLASDVRLKVASAEDLIVQKAFAGRTKDWSDVERIIARQGARLQTAQIILELEELSTYTGDTSGLDQLRVLLKKRGLPL